MWVWLCISVPFISVIYLGSVDIWIVRKWIKCHVHEVLVQSYIQCTVLNSFGAADDKYKACVIFICHFYQAKNSVEALRLHLVCNRKLEKFMFMLNLSSYISVTKSIMVPNIRVYSWIPTAKLNYQIRFKYPMFIVGLNSEGRQATLK
jgi:hypothetical protein